MSATAPILSPAIQHTLGSCLDILSKDKLESYLHTVIDYACGRDVSFVTFGPLHKISSLNEALKEAFLLSAGQKWTQETMAKEIPGNILNEFSECVASRFDELRRAVIENVSTFSPYYLKDIDWTVKLVLASDTASSLNETLLMVTLYLSTRTGASKVVKLELNKAELDSLISSLSSVANTIKTYSA